MDQFVAFVRPVLRYRKRLLAAFTCSLLVGVLWCVNIGALYPFLRIVFNRESLQQVLTSQVEHADSRVAMLQAALPQKDGAAGPPAAPLAEQAPAITAEPLTPEEVADQLPAALQTQAFWRRMELQWGDWLPATPLATLALVLGVLLVGTVLKGVCLGFNEIIVLLLAQRHVFDVRARMYRHALSLDPLTLRSEHTGRLISRFTNDLNRAGEGLGMVLGQAVREPLKIGACLVGAALINWRLLALAMITAPLGFLAVRRITQTVKRAGEEGFSAMSDLYTRLQETLGNLGVVQANTMEGAERRRFHRVGKSLWERLKRAAFYRACTKPITETLNLTGVSLALLAGAYLVLENKTHIFGIQISKEPMTEASLFLFYAMLLGIAEPARKLSDLWVRLQHCFVAAGRLEDTLKVSTAIEEPAISEAPLPGPAALKLDDVHFWYHADQPVLSGVSLTFKPGERIVLMGGNGCGKSTLARMIPRFIDPVRGTVRLRGVNLKRWRLRDLRERIAIVPQDAVLFDDSIINNIRYGAPLRQR